MVESKVRNTKTGEETTDTRYFISSLPVDPKRALEAIRSHWGVEAMHWILDMDFDEDRTGRGRGRVTSRRTSRCCGTSSSTYSGSTNRSSAASASNGRNSHGTTTSSRASCSRRNSRQNQGAPLEPARARCPRVVRKDGRARFQGLEQFLKNPTTRHDHSDWLLAAGCWLLKHFQRIKTTLSSASAGRASF